MFFSLNRRKANLLSETSNCHTRLSLWLYAHSWGWFPADIQKLEKLSLRCITPPVRFPTSNLDLGIPIYVSCSCYARPGHAYLQSLTFLLHWIFSSRCWSCYACLAPALVLLTATIFHNTQPSLAATLPTPTSWGLLAFLATMVLLRSQGLGSATALDLATTSSGGGF